MKVPTTSDMRLSQPIATIHPSGAFESKVVRVVMIGKYTGKEIIPIENAARSKKVCAELFPNIAQVERNMSITIPIARTVRRAALLIGYRFLVLTKGWDPIPTLVKLDQILQWNHNGQFQS